MSICGPSCSPAAIGSELCPAGSRALRSRQVRWSSTPARAAAQRIPGCWTDDSLIHRRDSPAPASKASGGEGLGVGGNALRPPKPHTNPSPPLRGGRGTGGEAVTMLSRTADNMYWLARYVERAEYLARILEATQRLAAVATSEGLTTNEWETAVATAGCAAAFFSAHKEANEQTVTDFLAFSTDNPSSIRSCFEAARTNARSVRTALTVEMWDAINGTWLELQRYANAPSSAEQLSRFLRWVQESSLRFDGSAYRTMLLNDAFWFTRLGVYLERADNTARILDVKYHVLLPAEEQVGGPLDYFQWAAILRSVSALTSYHWVYRQSLQPWLIADLLILKDEMPRSLASCYENIVGHLDKIAQAYGRQGPAQKQARALRTRLKNLRIEDIFQT